jgi:four helix bundle protein
MAYGLWHIAYRRMAFRFEGLEIFSLAVGFAETAYRLTRSFPKEELFGLTANLRRAATSVALNVAEGAGRGTKKEFARFLDIALGSLFETIASFLIAQRLGYVSADDLTSVRRDGELLARKINSFKRTLSDHKP